jgi:putative transposase
MNEVLSRFGLSARRFCRLTGWNRSSLQYRPEGRDDGVLRERLRYWASLKPRWGAPILHDVLKAEGLVINHKRTERLYREEGLSLRRKRRRKLPAVARVALSVPQGPNERWSMDFIHDQLATGRRFRCLTLVDDFTRQCLAIHVDTSIGGTSVVAVLQRLALSGRLPKAITVDNGPEFTGKALHLWAQRSGVALHHIQPGKPMQNAFIESFNGTFRDDCLNQHWFGSLAEARLLIEHWRSHDYNHLRPHSSLGRIPPDFFALNCLNQTPNTSPTINPAAA